MGSEGYAIFAGTAVNDTSSVTATASTAEGIYGCNSILSTAVAVKLTRTLGIIPITLALAIYRVRQAKKNKAASNTFSFKKIFSMCAIGLNTNVLELIKKGGKPIIMGFTCWIMITFVSILVQHLIGVYYTNL